MDPLATIASVASLLTLAAQTIRITTIYCHEAKHAKEAAAELLAELDVLHFNLSRLDDLLKNDTSHVFSNISVLVTSTHACRKKLNMLHDKLTEAAKRRLHQFGWPLDSSEHQKTMQDLRAFAQWIQFALTIDGSTLLARTSTEVIDILSNQLRMFQVIDQFGADARSIQGAVADLGDAVHSSAAARERENILNWLSDAKPSQKHQDIKLPRIEGTGEWLLEEARFRSWRDGNDDVLWCHGIQGSGKSILASLVIDHLHHRFSRDQAAVAYFYFDYRDQEHQSLERTTASLLKQLSNALPTIPTAVANLYDFCGKKQLPPQQPELVQALSSTCRDHNVVYIIIDALDECEPKSIKGVLDVVDFLQGKAKVLVTSRPYPEEISRAFQLSPQIEIKAHDADMRRYIVQQIEASDVCDEIDNNLREEVVEKIIDHAQEMFLLAVLHVQTILNEPTVGEMEEALDHLPLNLHAAFDETINRIKRRPSVNPRFRPSRKTVLDSCHGLVTVDEESQVIRLVHYSVHDFLLRHLEPDFTHGEKLIADLCIAYQLMEPFSTGCCQEEEQILDRLDDCPFIVYAARYWGGHVLAAGSPETNERTLEFLRARPQQACSYQILQYAQGRRKEFWEAQEAISCNGLHVAAMFGLHEIAVKLLPDYYIDASTHMGTTALIQAASCGSKSLVGLFLDMNADSSKNNWYGTALHCAAEAGTVHGIDELLDRGVDVNLEDRHGRVPLTCAAVSGNIQAVYNLLKRGANVNANSFYSNTPLFAVIERRRQPEIVQILLAHHADPNIPGIHGSRPLNIATMFSDDREEVPRLLLDHGAQVNAPGQEGQAAIHIAVAANFVNILRLFVERGAAIDIQSDDGVTALNLAARLGRSDSVKFLLEKGADPEIADNEGRTPLRCAQRFSRKRWRAVVKLLLDAGAKKQADSESQQTFRPIYPRPFRCQYPSCTYISKLESGLEQHMDRRH